MAIRKGDKRPSLFFASNASISTFIALIHLGSWKPVGMYLVWPIMRYYDKSMMSMKKVRIWPVPWYGMASVGFN